jgi:hypothetical protein
MASFLKREKRPSRDVVCGNTVSTDMRHPTTRDTKNKANRNVAAIKKGQIFVVHAPAT